MNNKEEHPPTSDDSHIYIVQNGDTLQSIAVRFDVTVSWLLQINHMFSDFILPGDVIKVWKRDIENGYIKDIPARLVDPNNIEGHSPHGHLFLYPDRIVFNAEVRDESLTILFDGIKDIDIIIHPFNEITTIPANPVKSKNAQNYASGSSTPSSLPTTSKSVNIQSPLSLKEIKPEELLYLMMINYDESKVIHSGTEVNVTDLNNNADDFAENTKFNCVFFSSMRKYIEPFKHELVTLVNKRRIESVKMKANNSSQSKNDNNSNENSNNNDDENKASSLPQENNSESAENVPVDNIASEPLNLLEDADTWVPDYYKVPVKQPKKRKDKDKDKENDGENDNTFKKKFKIKKARKSDVDANEIAQQTISTPNFDNQFQKRFSTPKPLFPIELKNGTSNILLSEDPTLIRRSIPYRYRNGNWNLLYQLSRDGSSYFTFFNRTQKKTPLILLISTDKNEKIGAYLSCGIHGSSRFYGSGETFVFRLFPHFECFKWSQANNYFISSTDNEIVIGGGGASAIWIDSKMASAYSGECETFASPSLTSEPNFTIIDIEVWSIESFGSLSTNVILKPSSPNVSSSSSLTSNQNT